MDAQIDLNPIRLMQLCLYSGNPLSNGVILADESGLGGKTIEAGLVIA